MIKGIYKIINTVNLKYYIGSSKNIELRFDSHRTKLNRNAHENEHLQLAWNKYGGTAFSFEIIEELNTISHEQLVEREQWYLDNTQCLDRNYGYNIMPKANGTVLSQESIDKIKKSLTGRKLSMETRQKLSRIRKDRPLNVNRKLHLNPKARAVDQYTLDGTFVKTWLCARDAQLALNIKSAACICGVCAGRHKSTYGFIWKYHVPAVH